MDFYNRNLLILFNTAWLSDEAIEQEMECLEAVLQSIESSETFCTAFELVNRNFITSKQKTMLREAKHIRLRPFRFLINKN